MLSLSHMNIRSLKLSCAVPDCTQTAVRIVSISINNAPKKRLPCCKQHADAAKEDIIKVTLQRQVFAEGFVPTHLGLKQHTAPYVVTIDRLKAIDDLKKLNSLPPYDGFNPCAGDGYFALAMTKKYGMSIEELEKAVDFKKLVDAWKASRAAFLSGS